MRDISLGGSWQVRQERLTLSGEAGLEQVRQARDGWIAAHVPGDIHLDLMRAGLMADPSVGVNAPADRWPENSSWWYRTSLVVGQDFLQLERQQLVFDGMDLYAQVFVNGKLVGESANAFVPVSFDVRRAIRAGSNDLVVRLTAGNELAPDDTPPGQGRQPHTPVPGAIPNPAQPGDPFGHRNWFGRKWLRKPQASYGWDWQEALPNIGMWRDVRLEGRTYATLEDIRLDTLRRNGRVSLELEAVLENLHPWSERACSLELTIAPPDGGDRVERKYAVDAPPGRVPVRDLITVPNAKLWWPNGMGDQPLYEVTARVLDTEDRVCDDGRFLIGLRTVELDRRRLAEGSRFCVRVNGQDVFCKGANLCPHDMILARIPDTKHKALVAEAKNAHMTMFRINGVSVFEAPAFYEACDRAGILVYHDLPFTCATYPDHDERFRQVVRDETEAAIRLLRHHACIAMWSGGNECIWGLCDWYNPDRSQPMDLGGSRLYNQVLPDAYRLLDPRRPYWPSSPCGGANPGGELSGDCHWWSAYMGADVSRRVRHEVFDECRARFVSEWGFPAPCHLDSIREYLTPEEMEFGTPAWEAHTNQLAGDTLSEAIRMHYADPEGLSLPEFVEYGQMCQAFVHGHAMEALRFRKDDPVDDCQGALIWSYSDCWGETGWSLLDYYLRRKPGYYWVRRASSPVKVIVRRRGARLVTRLVNDTLHPVVATVQYGWWRLDGRSRELRRREVRVRANGMMEIGSDVVPDAGEKAPSEWLYGAVLRSDDGATIDQSVWTLAPYRQMAVAEPHIKVVRLPNGALEVSSPVFAHAVHTEDHGHEVISDNWFDLLPGVATQLRLAKGVRVNSLRLRAVRAKQAGADPRGTTRACREYPSSTPSARP